MWADGCKVRAKYLQGKFWVGGLLQYLINQALTLVVSLGHILPSLCEKDKTGSVHLAPSRVPVKSWRHNYSPRVMLLRPTSRLIPEVFVRNHHRCLSLLNMSGPAPGRVLSWT